MRGNKQHRPTDYLDAAARDFEREVARICRNRIQRFSDNLRLILESFCIRYGLTTQLDDLTGLEEEVEDEEDVITIKWEYTPIERHLYAILFCQRLYDMRSQMEDGDKDYFKQSCVDAAINSDYRAIHFTGSGFKRSYKSEYLKLYLDSTHSELGDNEGNSHAQYLSDAFIFHINSMFLFELPLEFRNKIRSEVFNLLSPNGVVKVTDKA